MSSWREVTLRTKAYALERTTARPRALVLGCHGYAETPERAMEALHRMRVRRAILMAPMGPHHFYNRAGEVVASWMTRHRREDQISQQLSFLERLVRDARTRHGSLPVYVFGFSQGAAAAYRLIALAAPRPRAAYILAGDMPPEVANELADVAPRPIVQLWGEEDPVVGRPVLERDMRRLRRARWPVELLTYSGRAHACFEEAMSEIGRRIEADLLGIEGG